MIGALHSYQNLIRLVLLKSISLCLEKKIDISEIEAKHVFQVITELPNKLDQVSLVDVNFRVRILEKIALNARKFK